MDKFDSSDEHVSKKFLAGHRLLDKFAGQWEQLHCVNEKNIDKSCIAIERLSSLDRCSRQRLEAINSITANYKALSGLEEQINNISCDLKNLQSSFALIESYLSQLAERNEINKCDLFIRQYRGNYEAQAQRVKIQTELVRDHLMSEHLHRVQTFETEQQSELEDRRRVLAREFEAEKARYLSTTPDTSKQVL